MALVFAGLLAALASALLVLPGSGEAAVPPSEATLVTDLNQTGSSNPNLLARVGDSFFFTADDGVHGREL